MTGQHENGSRRVWTADEIEQQLDEVAEVLVRGASEFVKGLFFGGPQRPVRKQRGREADDGR